MLETAQTSSKLSETTSRVLKYDLLPKQVEFLNVPNRDRVTMDISLYQGGFGAGKTWIGCLLGIFLCQKYPGLLLLSVAKTFTLIEDTTLRMYKEHIEAMGFVNGKDYRVKNANGKASIKFVCWGNSEIIFKHLQDPESIKSINAGAIQVEEMSQITREDFTALIGRLRQKGIQCRRLFGHSNPQPNRGWIHDVFVANNHGITEIVVGEETRALQYRRIIAPTTQNPHLDPIYIEALRQQFDEDYYRIYVLGEDGDYMKGLLVKNWSVANEDNNVVYDDRYPIYLSCDFNVDPMCWVLAHRVDNEFHFFDEIFIENTHIDEAATEFCNRYGSHTRGVIITGDASGNMRRAEASRTTGQTSYKQLVNVLSENRVRNVSMDVPSANPNLQDRYSAFNFAVCNTDGNRRVKVNPTKCPKLIYNIYNMRYQPGTSIVWLPSPKELEASREARSLGHMYDAASYLVTRYAPIRQQVRPGTMLNATRRIISSNNY